MRTLHEEYCMSYAELAENSNASVSGTANLCRYERRNQTAEAFKAA